MTKRASPLVLMFWLWLAVTTSVYASTTINVTSTTDSTGTGTLRSAITSANNATSLPVIINLPAGTYKLSLGELQLGPSVGTGAANSIYIYGAGAATTIISNTDGTSRVFDLDPNSGGGSSFAIANVTITGGNDTSTSSTLVGDGGGAILTGDAGAGGDKLYLTNCIFSGNKASGNATGSAGAAIVSDGGSVVISGCTFINNSFSGTSTAEWLGAGIDFISDDAGDTLTIVNSTFLNNTIAGGTSNYAQGGAVAMDVGNVVGTMYMTNCVFGGNTISSSKTAGADFGGGAIYVGAGSSSYIIGCTFTNNAANGNMNKGGAILFAEKTTNVVQYCRFFGNTVASGGSGANIYINSTGAGPFTGTDNWWASDAGPGSSFSGPTTPSNWLYFTNTSSFGTIVSGGTTTLTASFLKDSAGNVIAASKLGALTNLAVTWGATDGSISGAQSVIQTTGQATSTFTGTTAGSGSGTATVDGVTSSAAISVEAVVTSVTSSPTSAYYKAGQTVPITINFSSAVAVTGTPKLALADGGTADYVSGNGSTALIFNYTVGAGDTSSHLDYSSTSALSLNSGTITSGGLSAVLTLSTPGASGSLSANTTIVIDTTVPTTSVGSPSASYVSSGPVSFTVTWSDSNFNSATLANNQVTVNTTGNVVVNSVSVSGSGSTRTVQLSSITGDGTVGITIPAGTASDLAGNNSTASSASATATVDNTAPTVTISAPTPTATTNGAGATISYTVSYSDANFGSASLNSASVTVNGTGTANGSVASVVGGSGSSTGTNYTVTLNNITGYGTLGITVASGKATDLAGNSAPSASSSISAKVMNVPMFTGDDIMANRSYYLQAGVVMMVTSNGVSQKILTTSLYDSYAVAFSSSGDIYVSCYQTPTSDYTTNTAVDGGIYKIDQYSLAVSQLVGATSFVSAYSTNLVTPFGIAVEPDGHILIADLDAYTNRDSNFTDGTMAGGAVFRLNPSTGAMTVLSTNGPTTGSNFFFLGGITVATNGGTEAIFVTDHGDGTSPAKVIQINPSTGVQTVIFSGSPLSHPDGLAVDPNGSSVTNVVLADSNAQKLILVSTNATSGAWIATTVATSGGTLNFPTHVAIDPNSGDFLVTDGEPATLANIDAGTLWRVKKSDYSMHSVSTGGFFEQPRGVIIHP